MIATLSLMSAGASAVLLHIAVRHAAGLRRALLLLASLITLAGAVAFGDVFGGFWAGAYTLFTTFFLACILSPWAEFWWKRRRDR